VAILLVVLVLALRAGWHHPLGRSFLRDFARRKLALVASILFALFALISVLDSIAWCDPVNAASASLGVKAYKPRTLIDRMFPRDFDERSYSAPLATRSFYGREPLRFPGQHVLGTTIVGRDTLHETLKGFRPAMMVGIFTTLLVTPIALATGVCAGYFGKRVDDMIQYLYSTLASVPSILLLIALMLVMGKGTLQVCIALGVTSWVGLCRLLRAETMKLRELDYVQATCALGAGHLRIIVRHIVPNLFHIVLISFVLRFSGLVLNESILSYFGVGLESSFGSMIVLASNELAREPVIWWNLTAASTALFLLVLTANIMGDTVRDLLDPRLRSGA
jgi:peptide/nickel transport system permease protein